MGKRIVTMVCLQLTMAGSVYGDNIERNKMTINDRYILESYTNSLKAVDGEKCNSNSDSKEICTAYGGSEFVVVGKSEFGKEVFINFISVKVPPGDTHPDTDAIVGHIYSYDENNMIMRSRLAPGLFDGYSLKAILIPQKHYLDTNAYSSNPTLGVAINFFPRPPGYEKEKFFFLSFSYGVGFNQITIDDIDEAREKTGFSYFVGYDFKYGKNVSTGIYFSKDVVDLKSAETFNSIKDESQGWIGLSLTAGL